MVLSVVSTEVIESLHAIKTKKLVQGSSARVYDCCQTIDDPFDCLKNLTGICRQSDYPDILRQCNPNQCTIYAKFDTINRLTSKSEMTMLSWIQDSTLWAGIDASAESFMLYDKGVYDVSNCEQTIWDHVIQIVGYGVEEGRPFWICKNSWGETWGEQGYIRIVRGKNMCGIATHVIQLDSKQTSGAIRSHNIISIYFLVLLVTMAAKMGDQFN
ncbi:unnamed protein product [Adineta ricciae]|uniref:Peptidase C1A papain C-terminal domain-containing protein n=1 Tax=Adineta ricciae TaxID=249248 RepID=A0A815AXK3_ADIRI|nr:unnamed protein product [Adineta ricciae]CAF1678847.1 unnamed protein product [Adineta ricciae]